MNFFGIIIKFRFLKVTCFICEVFKSWNNLNPEFMWSYFVFKNVTYNIRKGPLLRLPAAAKSTSYGINSVLFRACLCVCVCLYSSTCWFLPAARRLWHTWEVRINDLLLWVFWGLLPSSFISISESILFHLQRRKLQPPLTGEKTI